MVVSNASALQPLPSKIELPGQRADGSILLPNQWSLRPAGRQVELGDFPVNIAVHPDGRFAAVVHCGYGPHEIVVVNVKAGTSFRARQSMRHFMDWSFHTAATGFIAAARAMKSFAYLILRKAD